jgi:hypothetical protein
LPTFRWHGLAFIWVGALPEETQMISGETFLPDRDFKSWPRDKG